MILEDIDLTAIQDENVRQLVIRLLNLIESLAADLREAQERAYQGIGRISFDGMVWRKDIGRRALARARPAGAR